MKKLYFLFLFALMLSTAAAAQAPAPEETALERRLTLAEKKIGQLAGDQEVDRLERRVSTLERRIAKVGDQGVALFLFGAFCALWAQNTGRNSWLWFFLGLFFSVITVLVLLWKNSDDIDRRRRASQA